MKVFVINLDRNSDRLTNVERLAAHFGLDFERFSAVNGKLLPEAFIDEVISRRRNFDEKFSLLKPGEIGCALSHLDIYQKIIDNGLELALILEDDIEFDENLIRFISDFENCDVSFDLLLLGYYGVEINKDSEHCQSGAILSLWNRIKINSDFNVGVPVHTLWTTMGYIVSKEGAQKLLKHGQPIFLLADELTSNSVINFLNILAISKPIVLPSRENFASELESVQMGSKSMNTRNPIRWIYRQLFNAHLCRLVRLRIKQVLN